MENDDLVNAWLGGACARVDVEDVYVVLFMTIDEGDS